MCHLQEATEAIKKSVSLWLPQLQAADKGDIDEEQFDPVEVRKGKKPSMWPAYCAAIGITVRLSWRIILSSHSCSLEEFACRLTEAFI